MEFHSYVFCDSRLNFFAKHKFEENWRQPKQFIIITRMLLKWLCNISPHFWLSWCEYIVIYNQQSKEQQEVRRFETYPLLNEKVSKGLPNVLIVQHLRENIWMFTVVSWGHFWECFTYIMEWNVSIKFITAVRDPHIVSIFIGTIYMPYWRFLHFWNEMETVTCQKTRRSFSGRFGWIASVCTGVILLGFIVRFYPPSYFLHLITYLLIQSNHFDHCYVSKSERRNSEILRRALHAGGQTTNYRHKQSCFVLYYFALNLFWFANHGLLNCISIGSCFLFLLDKWR